MKKFDILKLHENFTDESNSVILVEDLVDNLSSLSKIEQSELLKQVLMCSEDVEKKLEQERVNSENFYKNRVNTNTEKRKVVSIKKVTKPQKEYINNSIKEHKDIIEKLVNLNLEDFKVYVLELGNDANINFYLFGLIKEKVEFQKMIDEAYLSGDSSLVMEIKGYINEIDEKMEFLKSIDFKEKEIEEQNEKCRVIFLETSSLRSYFLEDIDGLEEFYPSFQKIFLSLENGNPYKMRYFNNNNKLNGLIETRDPYGQTRIFFDKLNDKTYIVLHAIVKKEDKSMGYKNQIETRYAYYLQRKARILELLNNEEYLLRQEQHLSDAKEILGLMEDEVTLSKNLGGGV